jgi:hypothetical protein
MRLFAEFKRRNVYRAAVFYTVAGASRDAGTLVSAIL